MRKHPSIIYLRDEVINNKMETRDITFGFQVHHHPENPDVEILVAAIAVTHPDDKHRHMLVTERSCTEITADQIPDTLPEDTELHTTKVFPFVKAEGRATVNERIADMIKAVDETPLEELEQTVIFLNGAIAIHNLHPEIQASAYYQELLEYVHLDEGDFIPFLNMHKNVVYDLAREQFTKHKDREEYVPIRSRGEHGLIDIHTVFSNNG